MSSYKKRERRQVSFNTEDVIELELLQFADRKDINFSGLVKNLLFAYKMGQLQVQEVGRSSSVNSSGLSASTPTSDVRKTEVSLNIVKASGIPFDF